MLFATELHFAARSQVGIGLGIPKKQNIESVIDHNFYILTLFCPECVDIQQGHHNIPNNLLLITSHFFTANPFEYYIFLFHSILIIFYSFLPIPCKSFIYFVLLQ